MKRYILGAIAGCVVLGCAVYVFSFTPPSNFPVKTSVAIHGGDTGKSIATTLRDQHIVRSKLAFELLLRAYGVDTHVIAGNYYFPAAENAFTVAWRLRLGDFGIEPVRVVIPEGTNTMQMAAIFEAAVPGFDTKTFIKLAEPKEGYLFPDTYFLYPGESIEEIVDTMSVNFTAHIEQPAVQKALSASKRSKSDIVIMASLLEKEAPDEVNRQIISAILWKRIALDMPLQVDAVFPYITNKSIADITRADYSIVSPYNTYLNKGLPPGPITNPSVDAILAATVSSTTPYLYYLSDKQGVFHYSATYKEQVANEKKYLQ